MERHSYSKVSRKVLPETMRKLCFSTKFSHLSQLVVRKVVNPLICSTCGQDLISSCNNCNLIVVFHTFLKFHLIRNMIWYDSVYMTQGEVEKYLLFLFFEEGDKHFLRLNWIIAGSHIHPWSFMKWSQKTKNTYISQVRKYFVAKVT